MNQLNYWANLPLKDYDLAPEHPHRRLLRDLLYVLARPVNGILEVGCWTGQNLVRIAESYPEGRLAGIDVNQKAITRAKKILPAATFKVGRVEAIPFRAKSFDVVISDAVLMYVKDVRGALREMDRVARRALILLEWSSKKERVVGYSFTRDYEKLLTGMDYNVNKMRVWTGLWPTSRRWQKYGMLYIALK